MTSKSSRPMISFSSVPWLLRRCPSFDSPLMYFHFYSRFISELSIASNLNSILVPPHATGIAAASAGGNSSASGGKTTRALSWSLGVFCPSVPLVELSAPPSRSPPRKKTQETHLGDPKIYQIKRMDIPKRSGEILLWPIFK